VNPSVHSDDARFLELLERWLTGEFTHSDERELHALTAADPFRREAWEGFEALPDAQHEVQLERLRKRLSPPRGKSRPLGMWMALAAAFLLLLAAIYFMPSLQPGNTDARAQAAEPEQEQAAAQPELSQDTLADVAGLEPNANRSAKGKPAPGAAVGRNTTDPESGLSTGEAADLAVLEDAETPAKPSSPPIAAKSKRPADLAPIPSNTPATQDVVSEEKPVAPAKTAEKATTPTPDSYSRAETKEDQVRDQAGTARKASPKKTDTVAAPSGGWDDFHAFLRRTARLTAAARNNNISGKVRLEFTVGPDGKPANVRVIRPLGYGCDEEAMRLIRLFDWSPPGAASVVVDVPFVR
jgi:TonB family protein